MSGVIVVLLLLYFQNRIRLIIGYVTAKLRKYSADFYLQVLAAVLAFLHVYLTAHDVYPWYKISGITIALLWTYISWLWRKTPTVLLNLSLALIYLWGILV